MKNIGILFGGKSEEHTVSCISALNIYNNLDKNMYKPFLIGITRKGKFVYFNGDAKYIVEENWEKFIDESLFIKNDEGIFVSDNKEKIDVIIPVLHGSFGEDGRIQGFLDHINTKYVGNKYLSSAICMDKAFAKDILSSYGINQTRYKLFIKKKFKSSQLKDLKKFKFPVFVKPSNSGSSIGIFKVDKFEDLEKYIKKSFQYDNRVIIEEGVNAREIEVAIVETKEGRILSDVGELIINSDFYDYETKYNKDTTKYVIPAIIDESSREKILEIANNVFDILNCDGLARIDFFIDKDTNEIFLNEINTMPGFTSNSMYPKLLEAKGVSLSDIISKLIELALEE